jgi:preprotein translocase subunit SecG
VMWISSSWTRSGIGSRKRRNPNDELMTRPEWRAFHSRPSLFDIRHLVLILPVPMNLFINLLLGLFVLVSLLMVLVILMQRPKSEGLGAAFGGAVTENIFGAQTTNVLVKFTSWLAGIFFALTFALSILYAHRSTADSAFRRELMKTQGAPQASPAPTTVPQTSPSASPASDSGAGVLPAGTAPQAASPTASAKPQ